MQSGLEIALQPFFSEEIRETQALGNQLSAILLGKTTQRLQLTDTDFARAFKADFRKALAEKRSSHRLEGKEGTFKISYRTVIEVHPSSPGGRSQEKLGDFMGD